MRKNISYVFIFLCASVLPEGKAEGLKKFHQEIKPLFKKYCFNCHGPDKQKADLRMDLLDPDMIKGKDTEMWQEALDLVNIGDMPTKKSDHHPSRKERQKMVDWMTEELNAALIAKRSTGGRVVTRRLTNYEYQNTLRDLLDLDLPYAKNLPPEGMAEHGFKNNYTTLITSGLHLEYYERIARQALEKIILIPNEPPKPYEVHAEPEKAFEVDYSNMTEEQIKNRKKKLGRKSGSKHLVSDRVKEQVTIHMDHLEVIKGKGVFITGNRKMDPVDAFFENDKKMGGFQGLGRDGTQPGLSLHLKRFPNNAPILIRIKAAGIKGKNGQYPRLSCELGSFRGAGYTEQKEVTNFLVKAPMDDAQVYELIVQGENFPITPNAINHDAYFRIFNESRRGTSNITYHDLPNLFIDWIEIKAHHYESWPPKNRQAILFPSKNSENEIVYVSEILEKFMSKAYRRPVNKEEVHHKVNLFKKIRVKQNTFEETLVSTLSTVLCSPNFLFITEPAANEDKKRTLNNHELATRLSYFLWSSCPDEQLTHLASTGHLKKPSVLMSEIKRMIEDDKANGLVVNFTKQWLDLDVIEQIAVNPAVFKKFRLRDKQLFEQESIEFFRTVFNENLSVLNFIDSDFAVLNHQLAKHYRIPEISTAGFQKVALPSSSKRGGILTQASILFSNSTGADTHPIKRGSWVLEKILNDPPPPPPPNAPELPEEDETIKEHRSLKERLADHAKIESCHDCHSKIDPWGVAFENYNALGQWREGNVDLNTSEDYQKVSVDASTVLKNGTEIKNLESLKKYLLNNKKDQFLRSLITKMLSYSTGRYAEFTDRNVIDQILNHVKKNDFKLQSLIEQIIFSEPFQTK